jgi:hypothetical protein
MECKYVLRNRNVYDCVECHQKNYKLNNDEIRAATVLSSKFAKETYTPGNAHFYFDKKRVYPLIVNENINGFAGLRRSERIAGKERVDYSDMEEC